MENGQSFAQSLTSYPQYIPSFLTELIAQAENNDELVQTLNRIVTYQNSIEVKSSDLTKQVFASLSYFIFLFIFILVLITVISIYTLPVFEELFLGFGAELPAASQFFINMSSFIQAYGLFILAIIIISLIVLFIFRHSLLLYCPILGTLYHKVALIRFLHTTAFMLRQQDSIAKAIEAAAQSARNRVYRRRLQRVRKALSGATLFQVLQQHNFPEKLVYLAEIGEKTGHTSELMDKQATLYTKQVMLSFEPRLRLITLLFTILSGCLIAFALVAMYFPIFMMGEVV